jgi:hypothetical protein
MVAAAEGRFAKAGYAIRELFRTIAADPEAYRVQPAAPLAEGQVAAARR